MICIASVSCSPVATMQSGTADQAAFPQQGAKTLTSESCLQWRRDRAPEGTAHRHSSLRSHRPVGAGPLPKPTWKPTQDHSQPRPGRAVLRTVPLPRYGHTARLQAQVTAHLCSSPCHDHLSCADLAIQNRKVPEKNTLSCACHPTYPGTDARGQHSHLRALDALKGATPIL